MTSPAGVSQHSPHGQPITFEGCFGWLHTALASTQSDIGVVLCSGLGRDATNAHRSFRQLADQLAASGYPTLRFDYLGTGDSLDAGAGELWPIWQQNVHAAADWLRACTGVRRLVLIGLRIGAALAALETATRDDVAALLLLEPVLRGKSYVGQLSVVARLRMSSAVTPATGIVLDEFRFSSETLRLMAEVDLRTVNLKLTCEVSVFSHAHSRTPILATCEEAWREQGASVTSHEFVGLEAMVRSSHLVDEADADFTRLLSWMREAVPPRRTGVRPTMSVPSSMALRPAGCVETPLRFGPDGRLFGMLCRPRGNPPPEFAVVIANTGGDPHHGYARFSVELARRLSSEGVSSLRIDFAGLGDSVSPAVAGRESGTHVFETDRTADISAAVTALETMGYRHFAVNGLCSGAYHAFHGALADQRIGTLLLVNLPWFTLRFEKAGPMSFARRGVAELSRRGARTMMLFSKGDAGIRSLEQHFGPDGLDVLDPPGAAVSIVPGLDHDLTSPAMRRDVADRLIEFLRDASPALTRSSEAVLAQKIDQPIPADAS